MLKTIVFETSKISKSQKASLVDGMLSWSWRQLTSGRPKTSCGDTQETLTAVRKPCGSDRPGKHIHSMRFDVSSFLVYHFLLNVELEDHRSRSFVLWPHSFQNVSPSVFPFSLIFISTPLTTFHGCPEYILIELHLVTGFVCILCLHGSYS